jgi:hypothetical protein
VSLPESDRPKTIDSSHIMQMESANCVF